MPDELNPLIDRRGLPDLKPGGRTRPDPRTFGQRNPPASPSTDSGPLLADDRTGLLSSNTDGGRTGTAEEKAERDAWEEYEETGSLPSGWTWENEGDGGSRPVPPKNEEDEEELTTGEEEGSTLPSPAEMERIVATKIGGNRTPDGEPVVVSPLTQDGPFIVDAGPQVSDPSPLDDGIELQELGPTPREKLGQPPSPPGVD